MELSLEEKMIIGYSLSSTIDSYKKDLQEVIEEGRNTVDYEDEYVFLAYELTRTIQLFKLFEDTLDSVVNTDGYSEWVDYRNVLNDYSYFDERRLICYIEKTDDEDRIEYHFDLPNDLEEYDLPFVIYGKDRSGSSWSNVMMIITPEQYKDIVIEGNENCNK